MAHDEMWKLWIIESYLFVQLPAVVTYSIPAILFTEPAFVFIALLCISMASMVLNIHCKALVIEETGKLVISEAVLCHSMVQVQSGLRVLNSPYSIEKFTSISELQCIFFHLFLQSFTI